MPDLDSLKRSLLNALPSMFAASPPNPEGDLGGYSLGQAQTRLSGANAFFLPQDQYNQVRQATDPHNSAQALTLSAQPNMLDNLLNFIGMKASPVMQSAMHGPTVVAPQPKEPTDPSQMANIRHEAVHALLHGIDDKLNIMRVQDLVPAEALVQMSRYYNPQEIAQEIPARAMTDPMSLSLKRTPDSDPTNEAGKQVMRQYATMLRGKGFNQQASKLEQYFNLGGQPQGIRDDTQSFQKPNEVF